MQNPLNSVSGNQLVEEYIDTAYDNVKKVATNMPSVTTLANPDTIEDMALLSPIVADIVKTADHLPAMNELVKATNEFVFTTVAKSFSSTDTELFLNLASSPYKDPRDDGGYIKLIEYDTDGVTILDYERVKYSLLEEEDINGFRKAIITERGVGSTIEGSHASVARDWAVGSSVVQVFSAADYNELFAQMPYRIWKELNPSGTKEEFLVEMKGVKGDAGAVYSSAEEIRSIEDATLEFGVVLTGNEAGIFEFDETSVLPEDGLNGASGNVIKPTYITGSGRYIRKSGLNRPENYGGDDRSHILAALSNGSTYLIGGKEYNAGEIDIPEGSNLASDSDEPAIIKPTTEVAYGVYTHRSKSVGLKNIKIDTSLLTNTHAALVCHATWRGEFNQFELIGPGDTDPFDGETSNYYGLVVVSDYTDPITPHPIAAKLYSEPVIKTNINSYGSYYNNFSNFYINGFSVGRLLITKEDGTQSRVNQNTFTNGNIISNYYNTWHQGCGGGNDDFNVSEEVATEGAYTCINQASGTAPVKIGGEISGNVYDCKGAGLFISCTGLIDVDVNDATEERGTHIRPTPNGIRLYGSLPPYLGIVGPEYSGKSIIIPATSTINIITTRSEYGIDTLFELILRARSSRRYHVALIEATGSNTTPTLITKDQLSTAPFWEMSGDILRINNTTGSDISVNYSVRRII